MASSFASLFLRSVDKDLRFGRVEVSDNEELNFQDDFESLFVNCIDILSALANYQRSIRNLQSIKKIKWFWELLQGIVGEGLSFFDGRASLDLKAFIPISPNFYSTYPANDTAKIFDRIIKNNALVSSTVVLVSCCTAVSKLPTLKVVRESLPKLVVARDVNGNTALHYAVTFGDNIEIVEYLVESMPEMLTMQGSAGKIALQHCLEFPSLNQVPKFRCLFEANKETIKAVDGSGNTVLHEALKRNCPIDIVNIIINGYPECVQIRNDSGELPIDCVSSVYTQEGSLDVMRRLIELYPEGVMEPHSGNGILPLHSCCAHGQLEKVKLLLSHHLNGLYTCNSYGATPFIYAISHGNKPVIQYLCTQYPDIVSKSCDKYGDNPMHYFFEHNNIHYDTMKLVYECYPMNIRLPNTIGELPIHSFTKELLELPWDQRDEGIKCLHLLLKQYPESVTCVDDKQKTPYDMCRKNIHNNLPTNTTQQQHQDNHISHSDDHDEYDDIDLNNDNNSEYSEEKLQRMSDLLIRRIILRYHPPLDMSFYKKYNYKARKHAMWIAFTHDIREDGSRNILQRICEKERYLMMLILSYL